MRVICDFHIHSKYSRATSSNMVIDQISQWAKWKGIDLIGTGDFTHPGWFSELKNKLVSLNNGLYTYKNNPDTKFILTSEISCIYSQNGKVRKIHLVIFAPSLEVVQKINERLSRVGNLYSDGRPILGISAYDLAKLILDINPNCLVIPAHAWTPWFSIFGSKSGFDTLEECFKDLTPQIYAIETGLSSDPEMNWRLSKLDPITLISNSDAHSPANLGREATVFRVENDEDISYSLVAKMIKSAKSAGYSSAKSVLDYTIEFFPEEGKYHFDGHRMCNNTCFHPKDSKKNNGLCPVCKKPLTIGVMNRVEELADRPEEYLPQKFPGSKHLVPLQEIIAETQGVSKASLKVQEEYRKMINLFQSEFNILLDESIENLQKYNLKIAEGINNMRQGNVKKIAGYDGVYGIIKVLGAVKEAKNVPRQVKLF